MQTYLELGPKTRRPLRRFIPVKLGRRAMTSAAGLRAVWCMALIIRPRRTPTVILFFGCYNFKSNKKKEVKIWFFKPKKYYVAKRVINKETSDLLTDFAVHARHTLLNGQTQLYRTRSGGWRRKMPIITLARVFRRRTRRLSCIKKRKEKELNYFLPS